METYIEHAEENISFSGIVDFLQQSKNHGKAWEQYRNGLLVRKLTSSEASTKPPSGETFSSFLSDYIWIALFLHAN